HRGFDRSDDRGRLCILRDGRGRHTRRTWRHYRLCRSKGDRGDDPRKTAGRISAGGIPARSRHDRSGAATSRIARDAGANYRAAARPTSPRRGHNPGAGRGQNQGGRVNVQTSDRILERLAALHPTLIDLSLGRTERLLAALGNPHDRLPPIVHVAGTKGKGSTVAMMRACLEAAGYRVHAYISPHLVRFHERIRLAGRLIEEDALIALLEECERANRDAPITFFEITTAAA